MVLTKTPTTALIPPWASKASVQVIAHRGYKAAHPENTMAAFRGAVEAGADAIETDLQVTADGVLVLSHDRSLKRCFGIDLCVEECSWDHLSGLKTLRQPSQPMARLDELLEWLPQHVWLLLDLKPYHDTDLLRLLGECLAKSSVPWHQRIMLGCWNATFTSAAARQLPAFSITHITLSTGYSRRFFHTNLGFTLSRRVAVGPRGSRFLHDARAKSAGPLFVWTVNNEAWMRDFIHAGSVDGIITDDPALLRGLLRRPRASQECSLQANSCLRAVYYCIYSLLAAVGYCCFMWYQGVFDAPGDVE